MAKKETINYDGDKVVGFNLTNFIGFGVNNDKGDVLLIQAMFNFIVEGTGQPSRLGIKSSNELPGVTGIFDGDTSLIIISFQLKWMPILTAQSSGMLFPGYYKDKI